MPNFGERLAGAFAQPVADILLNNQLYNPAAPQDLKTVGSLFGSLLGKGAMRLQDESGGSASLNPLTGEFELMENNLGIAINPNQFDPSAQIKFQFGKGVKPQDEPKMMNEFLGSGNNQSKISPARQFLENQLETYRTNNPSFYRP